MRIQVTFKSGAQVTFSCEEFTKRGAGNIQSYNWVSGPNQTKDKMISFDADEVACILRVS